MRSVYDSWVPVVRGDSLSQHLTCDVVIIGAGLAGLRLATELARLGREVVVLEAEHGGFGASGRNGGILSPTPGLIWGIPGALRRADAVWAIDALNARCRDLVAELGGLEGGPTPTPMYLAARGRLADSALAWVAQSVPGAARCGATELAERTGQRARAALVIDAHTVDPKRFTRALLTQARAAGALIFEGTRVVEVANRSTHAVVMTERGCRVHAGMVVHATGAWASRKSHQTWMLASPPLPASSLDLLGPAVVAGVERAFTYRRVVDQRLLFGAFDDRVATPLDNVPNDVEDRLLKVLRRSVPDLPDFEPEHVWGGAIHSQAHELPIIRREGERTVRLEAVAGIYWALISASLARGLLDAAVETPSDARLRHCIASTQIPVAGIVGLGLRVLLQTLRGVAR